MNCYRPEYFKLSRTSIQQKLSERTQNNICVNHIIRYALLAGISPSAVKGLDSGMCLVLLLAVPDQGCVLTQAAVPHMLHLAAPKKGMSYFPSLSAAPFNPLNICLSDMLTQWKRSRFFLFQSSSVILANKIRLAKRPTKCQGWYRQSE